MNLTETDYNEYEDELFYSFIEDDVKTVSNRLTLPKIVEKWTADAVLASNYNDVPAAIAFFSILGQLCKDMIAIPSNLNVDDTRIQFLWMQTSGTGKSTLTNWFLPVLRLSFDTINGKHGTDFNVFDITDYTDAALIGSYEKRREQVEDENGQVRTVEVDVKIDGQLEGEGQAIWDEFEYSGVFKQSQHKEQAIVYLNTFMNTLWGETWEIKKKLKGGEVLICRCKRSIYATTYIPKQLTTVITEKGVLQRILIFIYEVPQHQQKQMRRQLIKDWGKVGNRALPKTTYAKNFLTLYDTLKERFDEVDQDPLRVMKFSKNANDALLRECELMEKYIESSRIEVFESVETFINRMLKHIEKMSILCAVAEAPSIPDKNNRFVVTQKNVLQASSLIRKCYKSLVSWLDESLRVEKRSLNEKANIGVFKAVYRDIDTKDGWVNKSVLLRKVKEETKKGQSTVYKWWSKIEEYFEENKINKVVYVRLMEDKKDE
jgi:hypothetical protein